MLARHPVTGEPIRIVQTSGSLWKDQKTMVWLDEGHDRNAPWWRWEIGVDSPKQLQRWKGRAQPDVILLIEPNEENVAYLESTRGEDVQIKVTSEALLQRIGLEKVAALQIRNLICLEEVHELYPFLGGPWDGSSADAKLMIASMLRMRRVGPLSPEAVATTARASQLSILGITPMDSVTAPPELWMIGQYYQTGKPKRDKEITTCLEKNLANPCVDRMVLLNEKDLSASLPSHPKLVQEVHGTRLTYGDVIRWIYEKAPENTICVFANSDIYLDDSWRQVWAINTEDRFLTLLRYDLKPEGKLELFGPRADSQDTWVIHSSSVKKRTWKWEDLNFQFGKSGCDNAINVEMLRQKFLVVNPALSLKTVHLHTSEYRTYNPIDVVKKPIFLQVEPTGLHDMNPIHTFPAAAATVVSPSFERPISGPIRESQARTFCTMIRRNEPNHGWEADSKNEVSEEKIPIHKLENVFQTNHGLVQGLDSIYVGKTETLSKAWSKSQMSSLAPSVPVEVAAVAYCDDAIAKDPARQVLEYLSKIFVLREAAQKQGEFWCPKQSQYVELLNLFAWPASKIPVLSRTDTQQAWCKTAWVWFSKDQEEVTPIQIHALRSALQPLGVEKDPSERRILFCVDSKWVTDSFAEQFEKAFEGSSTVVDVVWPETTSLSRYVEAVRLADEIVVLGGNGTMRRWGWFWAAKAGTRIWELQEEMNPSGQLLHLAGAAGLSHNLVIFPKGDPSAKAVQGLYEKLFAAMQGQAVTPTIMETKRPVITLPAAKEGQFSHAGDSFREMVRLWEDRGQVSVVHDPKAAQVWMNGVGNILLYDRPTYEWLQSAPPEEQKWRQALFGNPAPIRDGKAWSFWARRPVLLEGLRTEAGRPYAERERTLVFQGKAENAIQKIRRKGSWAEVCDEYYLARPNEPYPHTQEEYLKKLSNAKFGLCLAGFGYKCHREVECMGMGCVPIVASDVDMKHYAHPPIEGVHYYRVETPEGAQEILRNVTEETWAKMSKACLAWWKENASAEGLWNLTCQLTGASSAVMKKADPVQKSE